MPTIDFRTKPPTTTGKPPFREKGATFVSSSGGPYAIRKTPFGNGYFCESGTLILLPGMAAHVKLDFFNGGTVTITCLDINDNPVGAPQQFSGSPRPQTAKFTDDRTQAVRIDCNKEMDLLDFAWD